MGLACSKQDFEVKNTSYGTTTQNGEFYRTFEHLSYWNAVKSNNNAITESDNNNNIKNNVEDSSVASTIKINDSGNEKSENSISIDNEDDDDHKTLKNGNNESTD